ncbi:16S rRNA (cytidine(1402)-2'-O)-methyltransferase [Agarilytica rhodophyticola]|uniref:16S rRNA (cytidine(1402)-2'-O)-methyltransferase n=1 Tax=Agarilytica rhodophyticola TaxID=1737490 RepID=UPI000B34462F|nr:16S rRNA (cytidine(1402)-2'-O)-methyltransferase [Agarilytica rhodophyticola]
MNKQCALYIVATPIGNLSDISQRAIEVLRNVSVAAAEDTRHSAKLLHFHDISTPLISYHDHGGALQVERILRRLHDGESVALISDAGTPLISDPGYRVVSAVREEGFDVIPIPGACALIAALCASGLPSDRFIFEGFAPAKKTARLGHFESLKDESRTLIFYESTHRICDSLADMALAFGEERRCVIAREITKSYETFLSGTLGKIIAILQEDMNQRKGEFVVMLEGKAKESAAEDISDEAKHTMTILLEELPVKQAAALAAKLTGGKKNKLYQWALDNKKDS